MPCLRRVSPLKALATRGARDARPLPWESKNSRLQAVVAVCCGNRLSTNRLSTTAACLRVRESGAVMRGGAYVYKVCLGDGGLWKGAGASL
jgi:hypothetical protein